MGLVHEALPPTRLFIGHGARRTFAKMKTLPIVLNVHFLTILPGGLGGAADVNGKEPRMRALSQLSISLCRNRSLGAVIAQR